MAPSEFSTLRIDRDQVLHVARLARLRLSDEEIDAHGRASCPKILDHIEKIAELDLEGVEPTSHVVRGRERAARGRAPAELPRERVLEQAPDAAAAASGVPSPGRS